MAAPANCVVAVVDDDNRVLKSLGKLLESAGYAVRLYSSAEKLLQRDGGRWNWIVLFPTLAFLASMASNCNESLK